MSAVIRIEDVQMWYDRGKPNEIQSLTDINIQIEEGDYAAFFGPSGCGKTTLLYALSGIDRPSEGHVFIKDVDITTFSNRELALFRQTGIGIVFQQFNLVPTLSVLENVALPMSFVGVNKEKSLVEAQKLLERLELGSYAKRLPTELSGGQQQRVGIARALANNPPIIVADEPIGNLDSVNARNVLTFLRELNEKDGRTIIMVTHEEWSLQDARTVFHMKDGKIISTEHKKRLKVAGDRQTRPELEAAKGKDKKKEVDTALAKQVADALNRHASELTMQFLSTFFVRGHTLAEVRRFERFLADRLKEKITPTQFHERLHVSYADGGVGLWKSKADKIANYVESLINTRYDYEETRKKIEAHPEQILHDEVFEIRSWVTQDFNGRFSLYRLQALDELIEDALRGHVTSKQFLSVLHRPLDEFGAGFPLHSAQRIADRLDMVIDQRRA